MSSWNKINTSAVALRLAQCQENFLQNICFAVCGIFECLAAQSTMTNSQLQQGMKCSDNTLGVSRVGVARVGVAHVGVKSVGVRGLGVT